VGLFCQAPGTEFVPQHRADEAVFFEDSFITGLRFPPHPFLAEILRKFRVHLHQLTPNVIVHISKFLWAISSCRGHPTTGVFMMYYELHYQQYKIKLRGSENKLAAQFGCITFHPSRFGGKVKLTSAVRNKWPSRWARN
jgi:hypothetical protein